MTPAYESKLRRKMHDCSLEHTALCIIRRLSVLPNPTITGLAHHLCTTMANASDQVERLRLRGLLERTEDTQDRRKRIVRLTDSGAEMVKQFSEQQL